MEAEASPGARAAAPPLRDRLPVMGVPVDFEAMDSTLLVAVHDWLGAGGGPSGEPVGSSGPVRVPRIRLSLENLDTHGDAPPAFRDVAPEALEIRGPGFHGRADATTLHADCSLAPTVLANRQRFEESVLATLTLFLVTRMDRQPFHAAGIARGGRALLLAGPSGAGKSTLAFAAMRQGWTVLADDAVYLQTHPAVRLRAAPGKLHLSPDAARWFDELAGLSPVLRGNGSAKIPIALAAAGHEPPEVGQAILCLLQPGAGPPDARPVDSGPAIAALLRNLDPGFDVFRNTVGAPLRALVRDDVWTVRTGSDPRLTVGVLERILGHAP